MQAQQEQQQQDALANLPLAQRQIYENQLAEQLKAATMEQDAEKIKLPES